MRISCWSSDVCSSDLDRASPFDEQGSEGAGTLRGQRYLRYFLESGFTSVRDLNGVSNAPFLLSQWSAANMIPAPRVFAAGWIITGTGGHATERPVIQIGRASCRERVCQYV